MRSTAEQADLFVIRARAVLVETRTMLINFARGITKTLGHRLPASATHHFAERVRAAVPNALQPALLPVLNVLEEIAGQIEGFDLKIEALAEQRYPQTRWLKQVPGVGTLTALTFVLTLGDPERFAHSRDVGPFLGLVPRRRQSGEQDPHLRISKCGDRYLRRLLVQCAHVVMHSPRPRRFRRRDHLSVLNRPAVFEIRSDSVRTERMAGCGRCTRSTRARRPEKRPAARSRSAAARVHCKEVMERWISSVLS